MSNFEDDLDKIRVQLYEEFKGMSNAESAKVIGERAKKVAEQYNIKIISEASVKNSRKLHRA